MADSIKLSVRVPVDLHDRLQACAHGQVADASLSAIVIAALTHGVRVLEQKVKVRKWRKRNR